MPEKKHLKASKLFSNIIEVFLELKYFHYSCFTVIFNFKGQRVYIKLDKDIARQLLLVFLVCKKCIMRVVPEKTNTLKFENQAYQTSMCLISLITKLQPVMPANP